MNLLGKVRQLPVTVRRVIFWIIIVLVSLALVFFLAKLSQDSLGSINGGNVLKGVNFPDMSSQNQELQNNINNQVSQLKQVLDKIEKNAQETGTTTK